MTAAGTATVRVPALTWPPPRWVLVAAVSVVCVGAAAAGTWWWLAVEAARAEAAYVAALGRAQDALDGPPEARAAAARELEALLARHPSARLAAQAAWELGQLRYAERDWRGARAAWQVALARAQAPTLATLARLGIAATWEAEQDWPRAVESYAGAVAALRPGEFQYDEALLGLARVQERAGRTAEAIETYRRLLREVPQSPRAPETRSRLAALGVAP